MIKDDKNLIPLDDLSDMATWITKQTGEEGAIVITFKKGRIAVGVKGTADKIMYSLNCAMYQVMRTILSEIDPDEDIRKK